MAYNPTLPLDGSLLIAGEMRSQFTGIVDLMNGLLPSVTAQVDDTTTLPAGEMAQASAYFEGTTMHFTFAIPQGQDGQPGPEGPQGPEGSQGADGPPFANAVVDGVTTLPPGDNATVDVSFYGGNVHFTFGIPQGTPGEVTTGQMDTAIADAVATTSSNSNAVTTLDTPFPDPVDEEIRQKLNELIQALRR